MTDLAASTAEVIRHHLIGVAEEMRVTLIRAAFNPVIYVARDFGISVYGADLQLIAEAPGVASFLGANDHSIRRGVERVGLENLHGGDVVLLNYPYWNGAHTYDATLFAPVVLPGHERPIAFLCIRAHWMDLGAKDPGYVLDSTDVHQEGVLFPATKVHSRGQPNHEVIEIIRFNSRMPDMVLGDLNAQIAAIRTGERRLLRIIDRFGLPTVETAVDRILAHGEAVARQALDRLPEGSWTAVDYLDDDGISDEPVRMQARITIRAGTFEVDFAGSAAAARGPVNMPFGSTLAVCRGVFKSLTTPDEPSNAGQFRPLSIKAEPGTLFHAVYPAPTFTLWTGQAARELLHKALAQASCDLVPASSGGDVPGFMYVGHDGAGRFFVTGGNNPIGWGATAAHDGADALSHPSQAVVRIIPVEYLERRTPMRVERLQLRTDSGGPGAFRGGLGVTRDIMFLAEGEFLSLAKKTKTRPWALNGGGEPDPTTITLFPGTDQERNVSTRRVTVHPGDRVRFETAGGGGYGNPRDRDPVRVQADVTAGYVSAAAAEQVYGVARE